MIKHSTSIINKYIHQQFLPHLWKAITTKQIENKVERHMSHVISHHMLIDLLDSTAKNNALIRKIKNKSEFPPVHENEKKTEDIKVRMKKSNKNASTYLTLHHDDNKEKMEEQRSYSSAKHQNNSLIKLPIQNQEQSQYVAKIRRMKERMRRFQKQIKQRGENNANYNQQSARKKKSVHSQCKYHTYDYETNIMPIQLDEYLHESEDKQKQSLLECLKRNLDKQIQEQTTQKKLSQIQNQHKQVQFNVPSHKIQKIESSNLLPANNKHLQQHLTPLKPHFKFELSQIESLSKNIQNYIENGVKMVTSEEKIIEETQNPQGPRFKIKHQKLIHEKLGSPKLKTLSSQSILYSLQKRQKKSPIIDHKSNQSSKVTKKFQSLQLERQEQQLKLSQYFEGNHLYKQIKSTLNTPATDDMKLPQIKFRKQGRRLQQKKRTATQQKIIKGLDHIQIQVRSPHKSQESRINQRSAIYSAFSVIKKTESSIEQRECDKISVGMKRKKSFIKEYFNNYGNQFRFKRDLMDKLSIN